MGECENVKMGKWEDEKWKGPVIVLNKYLKQHRLFWKIQRTVAQPGRLHTA